MKKKEEVPEETHFTIDMPDVSDIPGQEHIKPPRMNEMADVTISSADEEGEGILDAVNGGTGEDDLLDDNVLLSETELSALERTDRTVSPETNDVSHIVDATDGEEKLNERARPFDMGKDLDIPGADGDDRNESIGEEDEENNEYSRRD